MHRINTHTRIYTQTHTCAHSYILTCTYTHSHSNSYIQTHIHTYIYTHTLIHTHLHTLEHTFIHTYCSLTTVWVSETLYTTLKSCFSYYASYTFKSGNYKIKYKVVSTE